MSDHSQILTILNNEISMINSNLDYQCDSLKLIQDNITILQYNLDNLLNLIDKKESILITIDQIKNNL